MKTGMTLEAVSIVSGRDHRPYVQLRKDGEIFTQMSPGEARQYAMQIIEAAEAAQGDAFIVGFIQQRTGVEWEKATRVLVDYRDFRTHENSRAVDTGGDE